MSDMNTIAQLKKKCSFSWICNAPVSTLWIVQNVLFVVTVGNRMGQQLGEHQILCAPDDAW